MKIDLCAILLALSIGGIGTAYAGEGDDPIANTHFTALPSVIAEAAMQHGQAFAATTNGTAVYATQQSTSSAFPSNPNEGVGG
jgi:hypothetical protein